VDVLRAGDGADRINGGAGADMFIFAAVSEANNGPGLDRIADFNAMRDSIDLSEIDADTTRDGDQSFDFIGSAAFGGVAGQLHYVNGVISGDVDGNGSTDFRIGVGAVTGLAADDFVL